MVEAIFLSASVPDPKRAPNYAQTANTVAITSAVSALVHVALGRRLLVWGGHPAITPMVWVVAQNLGINYGRWVRLYQSSYFADEFPEDNQHFQNVIYTENIDGDREKSLFRMRERMFSEHKFESAVFIGGMGGIVEEFELFQHYQPEASVLPIVSTGGATLDVSTRVGNLSADFSNELNYVGLFHRHLNISVKEERFSTPDQQPAKVEQRYWQPEPESE